MAISSEAKLCNVALARIGQREFIESLTEDSVAGRMCDALYANARDAVLESYWWPRATRRSTLALLTVERTGWEFVYALPADCLTARYIYPGTRAPAADQRIPFAVEDDDTSGAILLTDEEEAELVYTHRVESVGLFPALFKDALAWKLAAELAMAMPVKPQVGLAMQQAYDRAVGMAIAAQLREATADLRPEAAHIRIRG